MNPTQTRRHLEARRKLIDRELRRLVGEGRPAIVYAPLKHALSPGGKRLRALLVLLACGSVGGDEAGALPAAVALECLHNFTLIHDDVMDRSTVRRGRPTIHAKWNEAVAILAGDHLMSLGYHALLGGGAGRASSRARAAMDPDVAARMASVYTRAFRDVCEGQGYDLEFESRRTVTMREYRKMIGLKTARVIAAAAEIGGLAGGGTPGQVKALRAYGERIGLAFQIRDDVLDVTGSEETFGKKIGGDIARGKKTFLLVKARESARGGDALLLRTVASGRAGWRVGGVRAVYERTGAVDAARREIARLTRRAKSSIASFPAGVGTALLAGIADRLTDRTR